MDLRQLAALRCLNIFSSARPAGCGPSARTLGVMRPTIPIGAWRVALNLSATQSVQNQSGQPAYGCACQWCDNWSRVWETVFPASLHSQLERLCIDIPHPSDLYAYEDAPGGAYCRVIYHAAGKILSGPTVWRDDSSHDKILVYHPIEEAESTAWLAVIPCSQTWQIQPKSEQASPGEMLQIDIRLYVALKPAMPAPSPPK